MIELLTALEQDENSPLSNNNLNCGSRFNLQVFEKAFSENPFTLNPTYWKV